MIDVRARVVRLLAFSYALTVADIYYCQPLLPAMTRSFAGSGAVAELVMAGQVGYVLALLVVVPLGDIVRRRRLLCLLLIGDAVALIATAAAATVGMVLVSGVVVGLTSAGVLNVLVPYAATLAAEHERGRVVGSLLTGGLAGVLLSRVAAGLAGQVVGWRGVFLLAALVTGCLALVLGRVLDDVPPEVSLGYREQLLATLRIAKESSTLRRRSLIGGCVFAAFGMFWGTVPFLLADAPYHYDQAQIGMFSLVGALGAVGIRSAGRAELKSRHALTGLLLVAGAGSFVLIGAGARSLVFLAAGAVLLDAALRGAHLLNMSVLYDLVDAGRARITSAYMTCYTLGGVVGTAVGAPAYRHGGWITVAALGAAFYLAALVVWVRSSGESARVRSSGGSGTGRSAARRR